MAERYAAGELEWKCLAARMGAGTEDRPQGLVVSLSTPMIDAMSVEIEDTMQEIVLNIDGEDVTGI